MVLRKARTDSACASATVRRAERGGIALPTLILLRHGESEWNAENRFTGWVDVALTPHGEEQARHCGRMLRERGLAPGALHTSVLTRAVRTGELLLEAAGWAEKIPTCRHWRLNERCYGALQGRDRQAVRAAYGDERYRLWRRSYDAAPPPLAPGSAWDVSADPRYREVGVPRTESLADVVARLLPYWRTAIASDLREHDTVLVVAHSNSLRALVAHLDRLSRQEVLDLNIPTGMPLRYDLDEGLAPRVRGGRYLDPQAALRAAREVARQGALAPATEKAQVATGAPGRVRAAESPRDARRRRGQTVRLPGRTLPR
jgi:2,3-bisphosphoglycerate-dependent phosphoglycerate mutase